MTTAAGNNIAIGTVFVAFSVAASVVGFALEFIVKNKVEANKLAAKKKFALLRRDSYLWVHTSSCMDCDCYKRCSSESPSTNLPSASGGLIGQILQQRQARRQYTALGTGL